MVKYLKKLYEENNNDVAEPSRINVCSKINLPRKNG